MSNGTSWYEQGYEGAEREKEKRELGSGPKRWWMTVGSTKRGVFIDDVPACFNEHQWKTGDSKFPVFGTCIAQICADGCPACASRAVQRSEYTGHLTMVDIDGYTTKDGKEVKYELIEFCPKTKVMNKLKLKKQTKGSLLDQLWSITRTDKDSPNTGDDFDSLKAADLSKLYKVVTYRGKNISELIEKANGHGEEAVKVRRFMAHNFQIPESGAIPEAIPAFNYMKLHEPMSAADLRKTTASAVAYAGSTFGSGNKGGSGAAGSGEGKADDDVPF